MNYLLIIAGLPATGKTSFARYLSGKMGIPMVSKDIVKEHLFDTVGFKSRSEKVALGLAAMDLMYYFARALLEAGKPLILENNFEDISKPGLLKLIETFNCKTVSIRFHTEMKVLAERFLRRDRSPERHRGHVIDTQYPEVNGKEALNTETQIKNFADYYDRMKQRGMEFFSIGGDEIVIDTTDFSAVSYESIFGKIMEKIAAWGE